MTQHDYIDHIIRQWNSAQPGLDVSPMGIFGRITRAARILERRLEDVFAQHDLDEGRFDVLAALARAGAPHVLSPTDLYNSLLVTSGAISHRLELLARDGMIERTPNPNDGRGILVRLTPKGARALDAALADHLANEQTMIEAFTPAQRRQCAELLRRLMVGLGDTGSPVGVPEDEP